MLPVLWQPEHMTSSGPSRHISQPVLEHSQLERQPGKGNPHTKTVNGFPLWEVSQRK